ncbi:unnamed protein product, partial [Coffea canephora]
VLPLIFCMACGPGIGGLIGRRGLACSGCEFYSISSKSFTSSHYYLLQRRQTAIDELNIRSIFEENDVVCAVIRGFQHDGSLHLQARSQKSGKLHRGQLLRIPSYLVKRRKQHFHHLDLYGVDLILGCNGFIWVGEHVEAKDDMVADQMIKSEQENANLSGSASSDDQEQSHTSLEIRQHLCRIANAVRVLSTLRFMVTAELITN